MPLHLLDFTLSGATQAGSYSHPTSIHEEIHDRLHPLILVNLGATHAAMNLRQSSEVLLLDTRTYRMARGDH
jgi:hypothetical protein